MTNKRNCILPGISACSNVDTEEDVNKFISIRLRCYRGGQCGWRRSSRIDRVGPAVEEYGFCLHYWKHGYSARQSTPAKILRRLSPQIKLKQQCLYPHSNIHCIAPRSSRRYSIIWRFSDTHAHPRTKKYEIQHQTLYYVSKNRNVH